LVFSQVLADALTEIMEKGLVKAVGVCNYDLKQLTQLNEILSKRGIPIASNQVPINKSHWHNW
jgi:diketogulonate reductase-like aldo/keto reductase